MKFYFFNLEEKSAYFMVIMIFMKKIYSIPWSASNCKFLKKNTYPYLKKNVK